MAPTTPEACTPADCASSLLSQRSVSEVTPSWLTATLSLTPQSSTYTSELLAQFHLSSPFTFILRLVYALLNAGETEAMAALLKSSDLLPYLRLEKPRSYHSPAQHRKRIVLKLWNAHLSDLPSDFAYRVRHALRRCSRKSGAQAPLLLSLAAREGCIVVVLEVGELGSSTSSTAAGTTSQDTSGAASTPASSSTVSVAFAQALVKQVMKELQRTGVRPADGHTAYIQVGDLMCVAVYQSSTGEWQATSSPVADWAPASEQGACVVTVSPPIARVVRPVQPLAGDGEGIALLLTIQLQHNVRPGSPAYRVHGWTAPVAPSGGALGQEQPVIQRSATLAGLLPDAPSASTPAASAVTGMAAAQLHGEQAQSLSLLVRSAREYMPTRVVSQEVVVSGPAPAASGQAAQSPATTASSGQLCTVSVQLEVTLLPSIFREAVVAAATALRQQGSRHATTRLPPAQQQLQAPPSPPPLRDLTIELWQGHVLLDARNTLIYLSKPKPSTGTAGSAAQAAPAASAVVATLPAGSVMSTAATMVPTLGTPSQQTASTLQRISQAGSGGLAAAGPSPRRPVLPRDLLDGRVSLTGEPGVMASPWVPGSSSAASSHRSTGVSAVPFPAISPSQAQGRDTGTSTAAVPAGSSVATPPAQQQQQVGGTGGTRPGYAVGAEGNSSGSDLFEEMMRAAEAEEEERGRRSRFYAGLQEAAEGMPAPQEFMHHAPPLPAASQTPGTPAPAGDNTGSAAGTSAAALRSEGVTNPGSAALAALAQAARDVVASPHTLGARAAREPQPHSSFIADVGSFYALIAHLQMQPQSNSESSDNSTSSETTMGNHISLAWALGRALLRHAVVNGLATIAVSLMSTMQQLSALEAFASPGGRTFDNTPAEANNGSSAGGPSGPDVGSLQGSNSSQEPSAARHGDGATAAQAAARSAPRFPVTLEQFGVGEGTTASSSETSAPTSSSAIALPRSTNPPSLTSSFVVSAADRGLSQEGQGSRAGSTGGTPIPHAASSGSMTSTRRRMTDSAHNSASASQASRSSAAESRGHRSNLSAGSAESAARRTPTRPPCALCDHALLQLLNGAQAAQEPGLMMRLLVWGKTATCPMLHSFESMPTEAAEAPEWAGAGVNPSQLQAQVLERLNMVNSQQLLSLMRGARQSTTSPPRQSGEGEGSSEQRQQQEQERFMPAADLPQGQQALEPVPVAAPAAGSRAAAQRHASQQPRVERLRGGSSTEPQPPERPVSGEATAPAPLATNITATAGGEVRGTNTAPLAGPSGVLGMLVHALLADGDVEQQVWTPARLLRIFAWFLFDVINAALVYTQAVSWLTSIYDPDGTSAAGSYLSGSMLRVLAIILLFVVHYLRLMASQRLRGRPHQH